MRLLTAKQVAEIIGCSEKTIYSWAETGYAEIPAIKFGNGRKSLVRFDYDDLQEWITALKTKTKAKTMSLSCYNGSTETVASARKGGIK